MNKYIRNLYLNMPEDFVNYIMDDFLRKNEYTMAYRNGESVYYAGDPFIESYKYLKWSYDEGVFHLEAWIEGFAGTYYFESFDGFFPNIPHRLYRSSLENLVEVLQQPLSNQYYNMDPNDTKSNGNITSINVSLKTIDNHIAASISYACGIISILFSVTIAGGLIFGIIGLKQGRLGIYSSKAKIAKVGRIFSTIGIYISAILIMLYLFNR